MELNDPLPKKVSWIARAIGYSVGAVAIAIAWIITGNLRLGHYYIECLEWQGKYGDPKQTAMQKAQRLVGCVDSRTGMLEFLAFRGTRKLFSNLPYAPCHYVGTWQARREGSHYQVTLHADGQFLAEPVRTTDRGAANITGSWSVLGRPGSEKVLWLYDEGRIWPPDINPVKNARDGSFTLIEENRSTTDYVRSEAGKCRA
jgi:hypothetical protein